MSQHKDLVGLDLHYSRIKSFAGDPNGSVTAIVEGEIVWDSTNNKFYKSTGAGTVWTEIDYSPIGHTHPATDISDSTLAGRTLLTDANAAAQRASLGLGDSAVKNTGVIAGTVAAGDDARLSDARTPTAHASTHFSAGSDPLKLSDLGAPTTDVPFGSQKITNLADPISAQDASTKAYTDSVASGLDIKASVRALANTNQTITGLPTTIDGVGSWVANQRILLVAQTSPIEKGIWKVQVGAWTRPTDFASGSSAAGSFTFVEEGTLYAEAGWVCGSNVGSDIVDTNSLSFTQFSGAGSITAGDALLKTGNTLDVNVDNSTIEVNADALRLKDLGITNAKIAVAAAIARSKLASGTANHVIVNDGSGVMSSEASLDETRGGTSQTSFVTGDTLYASSADTLSKLGIGSVGQFLKTIAGIPSWKDWIEPERETRLFDDWVGDAVSVLRWLDADTTTGVSATSLTLNDSNHPGVLELNTGIGVTGAAIRSLLGVTSGTATSGFLVGGGAIEVECLVRIPTLADGTNDYNFGFFLSDAVTAATALIGIQYLRTTSLNWLGVTRSASVTTNLISAVPVASGAWIKLKFVINAAGTSVEFFVDGVSLGSNTTNIPTGTVIAPRFNFSKSAGTTSRAGYIDYFKLYQRLTTAR